MARCRRDAKEEAAIDLEQADINFAGQKLMDVFCLLYLYISLYYSIICFLIYFCLIEQLFLYLMILISSNQGLRAPCRTYPHPRDLMHYLTRLQR